MASQIGDSLEGNFPSSLFGVLGVFLDIFGGGGYNSQLVVGFDRMEDFCEQFYLIQGDVLEGVVLTCMSSPPIF